MNNTHLRRELYILGITPRNQDIMMNSALFTSRVTIELFESASLALSLNVITRAKKATITNMLYIISNVLNLSDEERAEKIKRFNITEQDILSIKDDMLEKAIEDNAAFDYEKDLEVVYDFIAEVDNLELSMTQPDYHKDMSLIRLLLLIEVISEMYQYDYIENGNKINSRNDYLIELLLETLILYSQENSLDMDIKDIDVYAEAIESCLTPNSPDFYNMSSNITKALLNLIDVRA